MARILYIEDDSLLRRALARMAQRSKHEYLMVSSKNQALEVLAEKAIDVVVIDYWLGSGVTGETLIQELKTTWPSLSYILVSGGAPVLQDESIIVLGKPFKMAELDEVVDRVL